MKWMQRVWKTVFLAAAPVYATGYYPDSTLRCQLYGIPRIDCVNSIYRPMQMHNQYISSFNLPVHKDPICSFIACKVAIIGSGSDRLLSIARNTHPPGDCVCLGVSECGCEAMSEISSLHIPSIKTVYTMPPIEMPLENIETKTVSRTRTVSREVLATEPPKERVVTKVRTVTASEYTPGASESLMKKYKESIPEIISSLFGSRSVFKKEDKEIKTISSVKTISGSAVTHTSTVYVSQTVTKKLEPTISKSRESISYAGISTSSNIQSAPPIQTIGNIITIPYTTVTKTANVTVPVYSTLTRMQYVVNTVDNYVTQTVTTMKTQTMTVRLTSTKTRTVTETVSDHIERTRFSTVYMPKTVTKTVYKTETHNNHLKPTQNLQINQQRPSQYERGRVLIGRASPEVLSAKHMHQMHQMNQIQNGVSTGKISLPQKKYMLIRKPIVHRSLQSCQLMINGCIDMQKALAGECKIENSKNECFLPPQSFLGPKHPQMIPHPDPQECTDSSCDEIIKTVYVRASATQKM